MNITVLFVAIFFLFVLAGLNLIFLVLYNLLVRQEEKVNEAWAQIATLYQRKLDLIPALMDAAGQYSAHEKSVFEAVAFARIKAGGILDSAASVIAARSDKVKELSTAQDSLGLPLGRLLALAENYPQLKADKHFSTLQSEISDTEDRLAQARKRYNHLVGGYNAGLRYFPNSLIAGIFKFDQKNYYDPQEKREVL
jgi:LemA protein